MHPTTYHSRPASEAHSSGVASLKQTVTRELSIGNSVAIPDPPDLTTFESVTIIVVCVLGFAISNMTQLAVNVISPGIQHDLDIDSINIQMISTCFALSNGCTLLLAGRLGDIYGHKLCLLTGLAVFAAFSLASATATSVVELGIFRAIQGLGASAISPALLGIIARTFAKGSKMRTEGFASFSAGSPLGASIGLLVGDWMKQTTRPGWRSFFYFSTALTVIAYIFSYYLLPADPPRDESKGVKDVDWLGAALLTSGLVVLVISLLFFPRYGWKSPEMLVPLASAMLLLSAFIAWENHIDHRGYGVPLVPISLFKKQYFLALQVLAGLVYLAFTNHNYFLNYYFQKYLGLNLIENLLHFLPLLIVGLALNLVTGHLANLMPAQLMITVGCVATMTSCGLSAFMDPDESYWKFNFSAIVLSVIGADFMFSVVSMFGSKISSDNEQGIAGAVLLSFTRIFSVIGLGVAIIAQGEAAASKSKVLDVMIVKTAISQAPKKAYWDGLQAAFIVFLASAVLAIFLSLAFLQGMGYVGAHSYDVDQSSKENKITPSELEAAEEEYIPN